VKAQRTGTVSDAEAHLERLFDRYS
jgi:hypothetical protein